MLKLAGFGFCLVLGELMEVLFFFPSEPLIGYLEFVNIKHFDDKKQCQRVVTSFSLTLYSGISNLLKTTEKGLT